MTIKQKIQNLLQKLNEGVFEKGEVIRLALLSAIAGESIFLLGSPGVAKSLIARRLKFAFKDATYFEYLINHLSTPDEIFGPVSISKLKNEDKYEIVAKNYLPSADVVFLDEIWKAGPSIQNTLLTVIDEKIYRNGEQEIKIPLKALIAASKEFPSNNEGLISYGNDYVSNKLPAKNEGLEALWDSFLVRVVVRGIQKEENFNEMITQTANPYQDNIPEELKIDKDEYESFSLEINNIKVPETVLNFIHKIRADIKMYNTNLQRSQQWNPKNLLYISDRRWKKIIRLLRTSAFLNGRNEVDLMDCFLIKYCIWNEIEQNHAVVQFVKNALEKHGYSLSFNLVAIEDEFKKLTNEIEKETIIIESTKKEETIEYNDKGKVFYKILNFTNDNNVYYITKSDFDNLPFDYHNQTRIISLYYRYSNSYNSGHSVYCCKSNEENKVIIYGKLYELETRTIFYKRKITRKPRKEVEEDWDNRVNQYLSTLSEYKNQLANYRNKDLEHLKTNLFVPTFLCLTIENDLNAKQESLEKLELKIKEIQHRYKNIEEKEEEIREN